MVTKSRSRRGAPLDRRTIAARALELIDADGLESLAMRRLGAALDVEAMALYHHFASKGELLDGVLELLIETMMPAIEGRRPPLARLRATFERLRMIAIEHPHAFILIPTRRFRTPAQLQFYERLLQVFHDAGLEAAASARYFRVLAGFVTGAGLAEIGSRGLQPDATPILLEDFEDRARYPRVSEIAPHLRVTKLGRIFASGLDIIFAAMEAELAVGAGIREGRSNPS